MRKEKRSFLGRLFGNSEEKPNNMIQTIFKLFGNFTNNFTTVDKNILLNDVVLICIDTIAKHCAKFEPQHYQNRNGNKIVINGDINYLLSNQPNPIMNTYDFLYKIVALYYTQNNSFVFIEKDDRGYIQGFYPVDYNTSEWLKDKENNLYIKFYLPNGKPYILPYQDLIHLRRFYITDPLSGETNISLRPAIQNLTTAEEGIANAIKVSSALRGIIKFNQNIKEADIKKNKEAFVRDFISDNGDGIAAMDNKGEFKELNIKPITLDKDQLEHVKERVHNYFNLNESIISGNFTSEQWNAFYETVLEPMAIYLELAFKNKIFTTKAIKEGHTIIFSVNRVQYASTDTKIKLVKEIGAMGLLTVDQALAILDLPTIGGEEGKKRMQSLNFINAAIADAYQLGRKGDDLNGKKE